MIQQKKLLETLQTELFSSYNSLKFLDFLKSLKVAFINIILNLLMH